MPLPESSLSRVCRAVAGFVAERLDAQRRNVRVEIGSPAEAAPGESDTDHRVNLFFYRVEPSGFGPSPGPDETWRLRLRCLVTAFGVREEQVAAGENDLRLLGEVLAAFHERPVLDPLSLPEGEVRARVVFQPLATEEINQLWATQGDTAYRPSVAYEVSLVPVPAGRPRPEAPEVESVDLQVRAGAGA